MELRILRKHLVADELNGKFTVGENSADIVGITLPRFYEQHDLSRFSFRIAAAGKVPNAALQILETDGFDEESVHLLWNVTSDFTAISEAFTLILTGVNSDNSATIKFKSCPISVNSDETWEFLPSPELSEQLLNQAHGAVQKAIDAANRAEKASQTPAPAEIYPATTKRLGGVKVDGKTITAGEDGTISAADSEALKNEIDEIKSAQNSISSLAVQIAHPNNFLIYDNAGKPSVMVAVPKFYLDEVIDGAEHIVHPAFIISGTEQEVIYISKYQNFVENGRAYSLPLKAPQAVVTHNDAYNYCKAKGAGWHMMTNAEWAAIALWCKKNGTMPKGNNDHGKDITEADLPRKAVPANYVSGKIRHTMTGSGRESWYHDGTFAGIADMNGNLGERVSGLRLLNGEINIIADNDAANTNISSEENSEHWKAILPDGTLVPPGTDGTIKFAAGTTSVRIEQALSRLTPAPQNAADLLEALAVIGHNGSSASDYGNAIIALNTSEERICFRSQWYENGAKAGVFSIYLGTQRSGANYNIGFRSAYYEA